MWTSIGQTIIAGIVLILGAWLLVVVLSWLISLAHHA
jgi:hypothetical protein